MTNSFLPSLLGKGDDNVIGLEVKAMGFGFEPKIPLPLGSVQICPCDWNTKYFPSAVHLPQHSSGGLCQPSSNGCRPVPSAETSRSTCSPTVPAVSEESNCSRELSGDHVTFRMSPFTPTNLRDSEPSGRARNISPRLVYASNLPSGDSDAVSATKSPIRRGVPPNIGTLVNGPFGGAPWPSITR